MPAGCCGGSGGTVIQAGSGIAVAGAGTVGNPVIISLESQLSMKGADSSTVSVKVTGSGGATDPYIVTADAQLGLGDLSDVSAPTPSTDDVVKWDGSSWIAGPAPVSAGAVSVGSGLDGDGSGGDPIVVKVSDAISTSTSGTPIYVDTNGELRAVPASPEWSAILNKPSAFTPAAHTHGNGDLTGLLKGTTVPSAGLGVDGAWYAKHA